MNKQIIQATIFVVMIMITNISMAQWHVGGTPTSYFAHLDYPGSPNDVQAVTIGDFDGASLLPNSFFHVNTNFSILPSSGILSLGEVFRTDCPFADDISTYWRMLRGNTHYGWLWVDTRDDIANDFNIGSPSGSLLFHTLEGTYSGVTSTMIPHFRISNSDVGIGGAPTFITTASMERVEVTPDVLGSASAIGFGDVLQNPRLLVVGGNSNGTTEPIAEFRSIVEHISSIGIKIRGARHGATKADAAFIDFANFDDDNGGPDAAEFALSRISSDQREYTNHRGYMRIYTADDVTGGTPSTLHSKIMIDYSGYTGIGYNLFDASTPPDNRLEVFDANDVQLRLSQTHAANNAASVYSDFQTISTGNLRINPTGHNTGFNLGAGLDPSKTVEIDADATTNHNYTGGGGGTSGLRFNDLASSSATGVTPYGKVLTVTSSGDVVLVNDQGAGTLSICSSPGFAVNYLTKNSSTNEICRSYVYEESTAPYRVGIGTSSLSGPVAQLAVVNSASASGNLNNIYGKIDGTGNATNIKGLVMDVSNGTTSNYGLHATTYSDDGTVTGMYLKAYAPGNGHSGQNITGAEIYADQYNANSYGTVTGINVSAFGSNEDNIIYGIKSINYSNSNSVNTISKGVQISVENYGADGQNYGADVSVNSNNADVVNSYGGKFSLQSHSSDNSVLHAMHSTVTANYTDNSEIIGGYFEASAISSTNSDVYGLRTIASSGSNANYGVWATGGSNCTGSAYSTGSTGNCAAAAVYGTGAIVTTNDFYKTSDQIFKTNINDISDATALLNQLMPKSYYFDTLQFAYMNFNRGLRYGLMTQDVGNVFPQFPRGFIQPEQKDSSGNIITSRLEYNALPYDEFIPLLIAGFKEQQQTIDSLRDALNQIQPLGTQNQNNQLQNQNSALKVTLNNSTVIYLSQNIPNPFIDNTNITFNIPQNVKTAQIIFTENTGIVLKSMDITQRGESSLTVFGENLSKGIYSYSLIIDGTVFETKKMIKQ